MVYKVVVIQVGVSVGVKGEDNVLRARVVAIARVVRVVFYALSLPGLLDLIVHNLWDLSGRRGRERLGDGLGNLSPEGVGNSVQNGLLDDLDIVLDDLIVDDLLDLLDVDLCHFDLDSSRDLPGDNLADSVVDDLLRDIDNLPRDLSLDGPLDIFKDDSFNGVVDNLGHLLHDGVGDSLRDGPGLSLENGLGLVVSDGPLDGIKHNLGLPLDHSLRHEPGPCVWDCSEAIA